MKVQPLRVVEKIGVYEPSGEFRCHSWITDGKVHFLEDCNHELAGQTLDLLDVDW